MNTENKNIIALDDESLENAAGGKGENETVLLTHVVSSVYGANIYKWTDKSSNILGTIPHGTGITAYQGELTGEDGGRWIYMLHQNGFPEGYVPLDALSVNC